MRLKQKKLFICSIVFVRENYYLMMYMFLFKKLNLTHFIIYYNFVFSCIFIIINYFLF